MPADAMMRSVVAILDRPHRGNDPRIAEQNRHYMLNSMLDYIEVLTGAGEVAAAGEMIEKLKAVDSSAQMREKLEQRLARGCSATHVRAPALAAPSAP